MAGAGAGPVRMPGDYVAADHFDAVKDAELTYLDAQQDKDALFGLALSGGGIRSASFALGVLQALHGFGVFNKFHYFSTVSGGGYIGAALTYFRNTFPFFDTATPPNQLNWFPFGYLKPGSPVRAIGVRTERPTVSEHLRAFEIVCFLRQHASFLMPSAKLGRPALIAGVLRGLVSSVLPYMLVLSGLLATLLAVRFFDWRVVFGVPRPGAALDVLNTHWTPPFYFAALPAIAAFALVVLVLLSAFWQVWQSSSASRGEEKEAIVLRIYANGLASMKFGGWLLLVIGALVALSLLPWLHDYLDSLLTRAGGPPPTFAALVAAIAGAAAQIAKLRAITGGKQKPHSPMKSALMALAGIVFVFAVVLLGYIFGFHIAYYSKYTLVPALQGAVPTMLPYAAYVAGTLPVLVLLLGVLLATRINVNHASQHRLYRDRLMEVFCAEEQALKEGKWYKASLAQKEAGWLVNMDKIKRPHHLINTTLVTTDSDDRRFRGRGGDNFILSPLFCGSDATGWAKTRLAMKAVSIATAAAVSGAALNAHTGPRGSGGLRNKAYAALLSFLGLNLGYWARNPLKFADQAVTPTFVMPNLLKPGLRNITGRNLDETGKYVQLSDGGHFENLAIYELIRRKVKFLWVSDAGQDTKFSFEDLSSAIERVRVDFGVNIRFYDEDYDLTHLLPGSAETSTVASKNFAEEYNLAKRGYAIGIIEYADGSKGTIIYIKSTLTRYLPGDIYGYKARNNDYPHQTTLDQFFDEEQFEAYRELGYRLSAQLFRDIEAAAKPGQPSLGKSLTDVKSVLGL